MHVIRFVSQEWYIQHIYLQSLADASPCMTCDVCISVMSNNCEPGSLEHDVCFVAETRDAFLERHYFGSRFQNITFVFLSKQNFGTTKIKKVNHGANHYF